MRLPRLLNEGKAVVATTPNELLPDRIRVRENRPRSLPRGGESAFYPELSHVERLVDREI